jgi:hypothetical protein
LVGENGETKHQQEMVSLSTALSYQNRTQGDGLRKGEDKAKSTRSNRAKG